MNTFNFSRGDIISTIEPIINKVLATYPESKEVILDAPLGDYLIMFTLEVSSSVDSGHYNCFLDDYEMGGGYQSWAVKDLCVLNKDKDCVYEEDEVEELSGESEW